MTLSASQMLHRHIGNPQVEECAPIAPQPCWICAGDQCHRGMDAAKFGASSMTDQNQCRAPDAVIVCEACLFVRSRTAPVPGREPGPCSKCRGTNAAQCSKCNGTGKNSAGGNYRNYSHLYDEGAERPYVNASKGEKPTILAWLRGRKEGRWFAAIADSGQKHILPYAPINLGAGRGRVIFDETIVLLPDAAGWEMVDQMAALLTAGATKEELEGGQYGAGAWTRCRAEIEAFERQWGHRRDGSFWALALWLAQRDEGAVQERIAKGKERKEDGIKRRGKGKATDANGGISAVPPSTVPRRRSKRFEALRPDPEPDAGSGAAIGDGGGMDDGNDAGVAAPRAKQLNMFGDPGPEQCRAGRRRAGV